MEKCDECSETIIDGARVTVVSRNPTQRMTHVACAKCWPHDERDAWTRAAEASGRTVRVVRIGDDDTTTRLAFATTRRAR